MRVGIIGLGSIGTRHAKNALAMGHECAGYDNGKRAIWYEDQMGKLELMLDVAAWSEAALICTPAATHASVAKELLALGYRGPLFCEKPLALSVADCAVFRDWPHPTTMVGYNLRFQPSFVKLKSTNPTGGSLDVGCDNSKYGNDVYELSHELDLAMYLGAPARVDIFGFIGGYQLQLGPWSVCLNGTCAKYYRKWNADTLKKPITFDEPKNLGDQMYVDELAHFLDCAAKGIPTITPFADGMRVVQVCEDAMKLAGAQA